jgi:23S rRNA pseudouridine1911/1915/1917 synthase
MPRTYQLIVGSGEAAMRVDRYLTRHLPATLSRRAIQKAIEAGQVTVDGAATKAHRLLKAKQAVSARIEELGALSQGTTLIPEPIPLEIIFEDDALLVVNKPPGLVVHPAPGHWTGTLVNAVLWHLKASALPRAGIVHRLDKDTSGLLVIAKTDLALRDLSRQLKSRTMSRGYVALAEGHLPQDEGTVDAALGRHASDRKRMAVRYLGGRTAVTHYRVLKRMTAEGSRLKAGGKHLEPRALSLEPTAFLYSVVELKLQTGRTHQIRVHLAHLNHPVLGDTTYGKQSASAWLAHGIARQLLHARTLQFLHPETHTPLAFEAPIPEDMQRWLPSEWQRGKVAT